MRRSCEVEAEKLEYYIAITVPGLLLDVGNTWQR